jgi:hypothetical protein
MPEHFLSEMQISRVNRILFPSNLDAGLACWQNSDHTTKTATSAIQAEPQNPIMFLRVNYGFCTG